MSSFTRRDCIQTLSNAGMATFLPNLTASAAPNPQVQNPNSGVIQLTEVLDLKQPSRLKLARQIGVTHAIASVSSLLIPYE